jgi:N utilization substance protein A
MEVPEIEDGIIDISSIARYAGERAKIIVRSNDRRIDPVGACVGMRGSRIQAIVRELNNEKIDIVNYSEQAEILLSRALSPAKPVKLFIDDEKKYCVALFDDDSLDAAIGRNGMNINLASQITDYRIDAHGVKQYERIQEDHKTALSDIEDVPKTIAKNLEKAGIGIVSELLDADMDELSSIKGIDEDSLDEIYTAVQSFVEREIELEEVVDEGVDISSFIDENNKDINSTTNEDEDDSTEDDITPSEELADSTHEEETIAKDTK